jgi:hypothetical protein
MFAGCSAPPKSPESGVNISTLAADGGDINEAMSRSRKARLPARMAVARIQRRGYEGGAPCQGTGEYCFVTARDFESDEDFARLKKLRKVSSVTPLKRLLVPPDLASIEQLRGAAKTMRANVLLVYSINTKFKVDDSQHQSVSVVTLGLLATKKARVDTTASAAIVDVANGAVLGVAEGIAFDEQKATNWSTEGKLKASRTQVEQKAFQEMLADLERVWKGAIRKR